MPAKSVRVLVIGRVRLLATIECEIVLPNKNNFEVGPTRIGDAMPIKFENNMKMEKRIKIDNRVTFAFINNYMIDDMLTMGEVFNKIDVFFAFTDAQKRYGGEIELDKTESGNQIITLRFKRSFISTLMVVDEFNNISRMFYKWQHNDQVKCKSFFFFSEGQNEWYLIDCLNDKDYQLFAQQINESN